MDFPDDPVEVGQKIEWVLNKAKRMLDRLKMKKQLGGSSVDLEGAGVYLVTKQGVVVVAGIGNRSNTPDTVKHFALDIDGHVLTPDHPGSLEVRGINWWHRLQLVKVRVDGNDFEQGALFFPVSREVHEYMRGGPVDATFTASMFRSGVLRTPIRLDARENFKRAEAEDDEI